LENIGKSVDVVVDTWAWVQAERTLDLGSKFVPAASSNKPFGAPVTGSWSKRGVFTGAISMRPWELTKEATDALTNEGARNETGAGAINGIVGSMAAVVAR
jgi:hypothetical protein